MEEKIPRFLEKEAGKLFGNSSEHSLFIESVMSAREDRSALIWMRPRPPDFSLTALPPLPFQPDFVDLVPSAQRPGATPLHDEGAYYCLDPSSVFAASIVLNLPLEDFIFLDMCAAPGGKTAFVYRALRPGCIYANEVIGKRIPALISNLKRLNIAPARVLSLDSTVLSGRCAGAFDLVIVDAPCSGQSLVRKEQGSFGSFHPQVVKANTGRQRRIIANAAGCVQPGGYLGYMTCTFSREENEGLLEWFLKKFPAFAAVKVSKLEGYRSALSDTPCYRLWPWMNQGAGAFTALLQREGEGTSSEIDDHKLGVRWRSG